MRCPLSLGSINSFIVGRIEEISVSFAADHRYITGYDENKNKTRPESQSSTSRRLSAICGSGFYAMECSDTPDLALPSVRLLETILAHTIVHDSLFDFVAGGHDEWAVLVNGLIQRFSGDLISNTSTSTITEMIKNEDEPIPIRCRLPMPPNSHRSAPIPR